MSNESRQLRRLLLQKLQQRGSEKTICPSEVAREYAPENWRPLMDTVREIAYELARQGKLDVVQKGRVVDPQQVIGPIRLRWRANSSTRTNCTDVVEGK